MTWCFRLRFDLGETAGLSCDDAAWVVRDDARGSVVLRPADSASSLAEARCLELRGTGFSSEQEAWEAGRRWRDWLIPAFAAVKVGADFGDRSPQGWFSPHALALAEEASGVRALNDVHGLMVHNHDGEALYLKVGTVTGRVTRAHRELVEAVETAIANDVKLSTGERLAYDLYAASFSERNADARFVMLMMAVETLIQPAPRSPQVQALVDQLVSTTRKSGLPDNEVSSIVGSLKWLSSESISQAGRRLAVQLDGREYGGEQPQKFFTKCYELRSRLVHGYDPRPTRDEVGVRGAQLEIFVGDLLARPVRRPSQYGSGYS